MADLALGTPLITFVQPGDVLLFKPDSTAGWIIAVKTWSKDASHCEVVTSRDPLTTFTARGMVSKEKGAPVGVNFYTDLAARAKRVTWCLRPPVPDHERANEWARTSAVGQKYDYLGLAVFALAAAEGAQDKMHCGEAVARWLREAQVAYPPYDRALNPNYDADKVAPGTYLALPDLTQYQVIDGHVFGPYKEKKK